MSQITVRVPDSILRKARELAGQDQISLDQFISLAMAEKVSVLLTADYLEERAKRGSMERFREILARVPAVEPDPDDRIE